jgi:hypothetical protein
MTLHEHASYQLQKCKVEEAPVSLLRPLVGLPACKHCNYLHILPLKNEIRKCLPQSFHCFVSILPKAQASLVLTEVTEETSTFTRKSIS